VKKFFRASRGLIGTTHLYKLPSPVHIATAQKWIHTALHTMCPLPSIFLDPPLQYCIIHAQNWTWRRVSYTLVSEPDRWEESSSKTASEVNYRIEGTNFSGI